MKHEQVFCCSFLSFVDFTHEFLFCPHPIYSFNSN